jgi:3-(3-hydroxy-phenyl)propionate hydroxylase
MRRFFKGGSAGMSASDFDIAVLGMGPVGCMATILLSRAGLSVAAIERDEEVYKLPRAVNLDGEIIRAMQPLGLAEDLNALLQPVRAGERVGFANSQREFLFGNKVANFGANGWQPMNMFDQPEIESFLRNHALDHPRVTSYVGYHARDFADHGDHVTVDVERGGERQQLGARWLLACDGASSFARKQLNIGWHDLGYNHDWLVVDVVAKPGHTLDTTTLQVCDPNRITTYVCTKDPYRRWEFKLNDGEAWEEMLEPEKISELIEAWTPPGTYEIRRAAMYQFHAATADTWRVGNVFIGGDAAHQTPPFLGQGMNAGLRDVINLAWKLPMVMSGHADDALLDTYQAEREAHAHDLVDWAVSIGRLMEHLAAVEAAQRAGKAAPAAAPELKAAGYGQGREVPPLRAGVIMTEQVRRDSSVGFPFAQPIVLDGDTERRLDELLGPGFAIVGRTRADLRLAEASKRIVDRIGARVVSIEDLREVRGHFDRGFERASALIVRPDRYVFGATDDVYSLDDLVALLADRLHLKKATT